MTPPSHQQQQDYNASSKYDDHEGSKNNVVNVKSSNSSMVGIDSREHINKKNQYDKPIERSNNNNLYKNKNDNNNYHHYHQNDPGLRASTPKAKRLVALPNLRLDDENQGNGIRKIHGGRSRRYNKDKYRPSIPKRGVKEANASFLIGSRYGNNTKSDHHHQQDSNSSSSSSSNNNNSGGPKDVTNSNDHHNRQNIINNNDQRIGEKLVREKDSGGVPYEFKFGEVDSSNSNSNGNNNIITIIIIVIVVMVEMERIVLEERIVLVMIRIINVR